MIKLTYPTVGGAQSWRPASVRLDGQLAAKLGLRNTMELCEALVAAGLGAYVEREAHGAVLHLPGTPLELSAEGLALARSCCPDLDLALKHGRTQAQPLVEVGLTGAMLMSLSSS